MEIGVERKQSFSEDSAVSEQEVECTCIGRNIPEPQSCVCKKPFIVQKEELTLIEVPQSDSDVVSPPDGGWGWFVVLGCFIMNFVVNGISYSFGVIFMELLDNYNRTSAEIAWVYSLNCVVCSWLGPLATALGNAFSFRSVAVAGGLIYSAGIIASSFARKLEVLYVTYGLISGVGSALVYGPSIIMVGRYFNKRRSLANGLAAAGSGVGSFLLPPLMNFLIEKYGIHGCILILGAVSANLCLGGLFYRPVETKTTTKVRQAAQASTEPKIFDEPKRHASFLNVPTISISRVSSHGSIKEEVYETALYPTRGAGGFIMGSSLLSIPENIVTVEKHSRKNFRFRRISGDGIWRGVRRGFLVLYAWPKSLRSGTPLADLFDFSLLADRMFLTFTTAVMLASFGYLGIYLIISSYAMDIGASKPESVYLVSIIGISDLVGRVVFGLISDSVRVNRKWIYSLVVLLAAVSVLYPYFGESYIGLAGFAGVFGLIGGSFMMMHAVLTADLFGLERLPSAIGLLVTIQGIAYLVGPPIIGGIRDYSGSFHPVFLVIACVMALGAALMPLEHIVSSTLKNGRRPSGNSASSDETDVTVTTFYPEVIEETLGTGLKK